MKPKYVKNPLSEVPGGSTIIILFEDGSAQTQHRVKYVKNYINAVASKEQKRIVRILNATTNETIYETNL